MQIGINALAWQPGQQAGVDTYLRHLIGALQQVDSHNQYVIFAGQQAQGHLSLPAPNFQLIVCPIYGRSRLLRALWEQTMLARQAAVTGIDVMLCTGGIVPQNLRIPAVQVIHDLQVFHYPENFRWIKRQFLLHMLPRSARAAALTIASSECSQADVARFLGQSPPNTPVVPLAAGAEFHPCSAQAITHLKAKFNITGDYLLCVATAHHHKNLPALVETYSEIAAHEWGGGLVLVGRGGSGSAQLVAAIGNSRCREKIWQLGYVDKDSLPALYAGATAFVMPSLFEGFGMTVLEAMQCGCPVACSKLTALPEVAGDAAVLFDPRDRRQFRRALLQMVSDRHLRQWLREKGFAQAARFNWHTTAQKTLAAIQQEAHGLLQPAQQI